DIESVVIKSNRTISPEKLDEFLKAVHSGCIRSKGYINMTSGAKVFLQGSFDQFTLQEVETFAAPTEFIVIGNFSGEQNHQKLFENLCTS
ncbi:MAG: GTP-binding protein, partial [Bacteroidota bacterium]|nr:GTP-binding protein [Bacteroidota bacterium]